LKKEFDFLEIWLILKQDSLPNTTMKDLSPLFVTAFHETNLNKNSVAAARWHVAINAANKNPLVLLYNEFINTAYGYAALYGEPISENYIAGAAWLKGFKAVKELINIDFGPIDSGCMEWIFYTMCKTAGFSEDEIQH